MALKDCLTNWLNSLLLRCIKIFKNIILLYLSHSKIYIKKIISGTVLIKIIFDVDKEWMLFVYINYKQRIIHV